MWDLLLLVLMAGAGVPAKRKRRRSSAMDTAATDPVPSGKQPRRCPTTTLKSPPPGARPSKVLRPAPNGHRVGKVLRRAGMPRLLPLWHLSSARTTTTGTAQCTLTTPPRKRQNQKPVARQGREAARLGCRIVKKWGGVNFDCMPLVGC